MKSAFQIILLSEIFSLPDKKNWKKKQVLKQVSKLCYFVKYL